MELIDFKMPPFARIQWASKDIKIKYEPLFNKARRVFSVLEKESVIHSLRTCTTASISPQDYDKITQRLAENNLVFIPIRKVGSYEGHSSYHPKVESGKPWNYYGVVSNNIKDAVEFVEASKEGNVDHKVLGKLLGYPQCCIDSFNDNFMKGIVDPQWNQALNDKTFLKSKREDNDRNLIRTNNPHWEANTMLRNFSIGPIFHHACSNNCKHTVDMAKKWVQLAEELKVDGLDEMKMFLQMPMEWDSLKGIAHIKTPLFKAFVNSNFTIENYVVQREGLFYPEDAPKAIKFPWNEYYKNEKQLIKSEGEN